MVFCAAWVCPHEAILYTYGQGTHFHVYKSTFQDKIVRFSLHVMFVPLA